MTQTVEQEREWWTTAGPENVWGLDGDGITNCMTMLRPILDRYGSRILDLGCGPGRLLAPLAAFRNDLDLVGVDIIDYYHADDTDITWLVGDGRTIPAAAGTFDGVYSIGLFQHLPHDVTLGYLTDIASRLRPGGHVVFQHVLGTEDSFLAHQVAGTAQLVEMCDAAGLTVRRVDLGHLHYQWAWTTARVP